MCRADAEAVKVGLALAEAVFEAARGGQGGALLPLQTVFTLRFCLLTPPVGLQGVGCLPPSADGAHIITAICVIRFASGSHSVFAFSHRLLVSKVLAVCRPLQMVHTSLLPSVSSDLLKDHTLFLPSHTAC